MRYTAKFRLVRLCPVFADPVTYEVRAMVYLGKMCRDYTLFTAACVIFLSAYTFIYIVEIKPVIMHRDL